MIAAIYARKSSKQDDAVSVKRQVANATTFCTARGWSVGETFIDDNVSGAETTKLVEKQRLLSSLDRFDVVVMQAQDRWSRRDGDESFAELKAMAKRVQVHFYADGSQFKFGTLSTNIEGFLKGEFAAEYRRVIRVKTHEAMVRKFLDGHSTGGMTFGYTNVRTGAHVDRQINPTEAAVVLDIYTRYARGEGFKAIAHALNAAKTPSPRPQRGRPIGWEPGTIRSVLRRDIYRGIAVYNKTKKRDSTGSRHRGRAPRNPESEVLTLAAPHLRIVPKALVEQVDKRLAKRRQEFLRTPKGKLQGRVRGVPDERSHHLLAGFLECACGARFEAVRGIYVCAARRRKGPSVCASDISFTAREIEESFLDALEGTVLAPTFIENLVEEVFAQPVDAGRPAALAERGRVVTEIANLTTAIAHGGNIPALAAALKERDSRLVKLDAQLAKPEALPLNRKALRDALTLRGTEWRAVLRGPHIAQARVVLQHIMNLPLKVINDPVPAYIKKGDTRGTEGIKWTAETRPEGLLIGILADTSPTGFEPVFWP